MAAHGDGPGRPVELDDPDPDGGEAGVGAAGCFDVEHVVPRASVILLCGTKDDGVLRRSPDLDPAVRRQFPALLLGVVDVGAGDPAEAHRAVGPVLHLLRAAAVLARAERDVPGARARGVEDRLEGYLLCALVEVMLPRLVLRGALEVEGGDDEESEGEKAVPDVHGVILDVDGCE